MRCVGTMGWLQVVGSLKLKVSSVKEPYERDDILQKRLIILRSLLIVATPYHTQHNECPAPPARVPRSSCMRRKVYRMSDEMCPTQRGGGLGSSTIFKNLMSPTPRRKWYLTTGRRAH